MAEKEVRDIITDLSFEIHKNNVAKGFYDKKTSTAERLALVHSEVSEALEADRKDRRSSIAGIDASFLNLSDDDFKAYFETYIKDTFEDELADAMIRLMDMSAYEFVDIGLHIEAKLRYNKLRPYKHGKRY